MLGINQVVPINLTNPSRESGIKTHERLMLKHKETNELIIIPPHLSKCLITFSTGGSSKEIGKKLNLSKRTIEHYLAHLRKVLGCKNSKELIITYFSQLNDQ